MKKLIAVFLILFSLNGLCQDYHYWSEHYGTRASLLGGAATAGLGDIATVYYNPAAMAFTDKPSLSVTVNAYKIRSVKLHNAVGDGLDMKQTQFSTFPNFIGGMAKFKKLPRIRLGYAMLAKRAWVSNFDHLFEGEFDLVVATPGLEHYTANYNLFHSINEYLGGFAISYKLSDTWSIGFAHFGNYRSVKYSNNIDVNVFPADSTPGALRTISSEVNFNYYNIKGIIKPSIAIDAKNFKFGMVYTSPSFSILGKGNVYRKSEFINYEFKPGQFATASLVDSRKGVNVKHKEAASLALGVSWRFKKKAWLHFTNEIFFAVPYYLLFDPSNEVNVYPTNYFVEDTIYAFGGDQNFLAYGEQSEPVVNFGLGFESKIGERWEVLLGARTDFLFNYLGISTYSWGRIYAQSSRWHLYHFSMGFSRVSKKSKKFTIGLEYGMTPKSNFQQFVSFTDPAGGDKLYYLDLKENAYASQFSFEIVIGIELHAAKGFTTEEIPVKP